MIDKDRLYNRIYSVCPVERQDFEEDYDCALREICALCGRKYVYADGSGESDEVREEYESALCSEILFYLRGDPYDRERFLERTREAFSFVWRDRAYEARRREAAV